MLVLLLLLLFFSFLFFSSLLFSSLLCLFGVKGAKSGVNEEIDVWMFQMLEDLPNPEAAIGEKGASASGSGFYVQGRSRSGSRPRFKSKIRE